MNKQALKITEIIVNKFDLKFESDLLIDLSIDRREKLAHSLVEFTFNVYDNVCKKLKDYDLE